MGWGAARVLDGIHFGFVEAANAKCLVGEGKKDGKFGLLNSQLFIDRCGSRYGYALKKDATLFDPT